MASTYKKWQQNIIKKTKEILQRKARENYQHLPEEEKNVIIVVINTKSFLGLEILYFYHNLSYVYY